MSTEQATPRSIVVIVVVTLAALCVLYMVTLAICILRGLSPDEKVLLQFVAGGTYVMGVFSGMLINPRGPQTGGQTSTTTQEVQVTKTISPLAEPASSEVTKP
jgi:hypothetical protein